MPISPVTPAELGDLSRNLRDPKTTKTMTTRHRWQCCDDCIGYHYQKATTETSRFVKMGSVRYGMRVRAVSPPPPGVGPLYRAQQCCWPSSALSQIPLLNAASHQSINNLDIISCGVGGGNVDNDEDNYVNDEDDDDDDDADEEDDDDDDEDEDDDDDSTKNINTKQNASSVPAEQTRNVLSGDENNAFKYHHTFLRRQQSGSLVLRPSTFYARLRSHPPSNIIQKNRSREAAENGFKEEPSNSSSIIDTLDRLPRFRFGGNRTTVKSTSSVRGGSTNSTRTNNDQKLLRELSERLRRTPSVRVESHAKLTSDHTDKTSTAPFRSASFSQVDYSTEREKYIRKRCTNFQRDEASPHCSVPTTLPRTKITNECGTTIDSENPVANESGGDCKALTNSNSSPSCTVVRNNNEKKQRGEKSRRRKGIYISQWPDAGCAASASDEGAIIPPFVVDESRTVIDNESAKLLEESIAEITKFSEESAAWANIDPEQQSSEEWSRTTPPSPQPPPSSPPPRPPPTQASLSPEIPPLVQLLRSDSEEGETDATIRLSPMLSDISDSETTRLGSSTVPGLIADVNYTSVPRRYSKRPLRGPYGQMLEAEMKKPELVRKNQMTSGDLKFLEDLQQLDGEGRGKFAWSRSSCNSSFDDGTSSKDSCQSLLSCKQGTIKRKISADSLVINNNEGVDENRLVVSHQRTTSSPSKLEGSSNVNVNLSSELLQTGSEQFPDRNLQKSDTRTHVVVEFYENEKTYVESLQILVTKYLEPLKGPENANLLDANLVDDIFYQIPFLLSHHKVFLDELKCRLEHWDVRQKIGDVFLGMFSRSSVIENYTNYVNNWKRARDIIKNTQQSKPAFAKFLEAAARGHKGKLPLDSLLIKPIQKFPKYELLLQRLIKHTDVEHPDYSLLLAAQREVHEQLLKINCTEREALELEQLREIEGMIAGLMDLVVPDRQYLRHDLVQMAAGNGARKERALFLFSDLLLVTSIKRKSGTIKKPISIQGSVSSVLEANKFKLLMKMSLADFDIVKAKDDKLTQIMMEIDNITEDIGVISQINEIAWSLHCNHSQLDEFIKDMLASLNKQLQEHQTVDSQLCCLDLILHTTDGLQNLSIVFPKSESRASWEESFNEAKQKLAASGDRRPSPELIATVPIRKTRAGLQFTCAAPTLGETGKDVWVCNSDGYVGQVCVLSMRQPEPTVASCNTVCNARILCIASVPGTGYRSPVEGGTSSGSSSRERIDEVKTIQFDSSSSSDEDDKSDNEEASDSKFLDSSETASVDFEEIDSQQSTMWLGTEDGCIHVYNASNNIRIKKNKIKIQHSSSILSIMYLENRVFAALANGDLTIYDRDSCNWSISTPTTVSIGSASAPITKILPNGSKLWCTSGNAIKVFNTQTMQSEASFTINNDCSYKAIACVELHAGAVWLAMQNSAVVKGYHAGTFEPLCEVNVAPAVTKMLTSCDDIIRQHKAACLRVTTLLASKDLLWIGTSAGVLLTLTLPHVMPSTGKLLVTPSVNGVSHGHTGHVRFLTLIELNYGADIQHQHHRNSYKGKPEQRATPKSLIITGGDGYENFRGTNSSEIAGREDSTNHLLLWSN